MYQEDYLFARVGICADRHSWFGCPVPHAPAPVEETMDETAPDELLPAETSREARTQGGVSGGESRGRESRVQTEGKCREGWFRRRRKVRERQRELRRRQQEYMQKLQEYMQKLQEYKELQEELAASMRQLWKEVFSEVERAGGAGEVRCVYEDSLRFLAEGRGEAAICWSLLWNIPEFRDYKSMRWVRPLLEYVRHSDFILLGTADCIPAMLQGLARRMKSLQWYLREEDLSEEVQGWVEDFYEEYGLAVTLRELTGENAFSQLRLKSGEPVCVMDFTDEEKLSAGDLAGGSIWIDFASVDGKSKRMERQAPEVSYMSLKKYWSAKTKMKPGIPKCHTASRFRLS